VSGFHYLHDHADDPEFNVDKTKLFLAGESGGANLSLATALRLKKSGHVSMVGRFGRWVSGRVGERFLGVCVLGQWYVCVRVGGWVGGWVGGCGLVRIACVEVSWVGGARALGGSDC
jgi:hypothetical protein